jgi:hypothetical protein
VQIIAIKVNFIHTGTSDGHSNPRTVPLAKTVQKLPLTWNDWIHYGVFVGSYVVLGQNRNIVLIYTFTKTADRKFFVPAGTKLAGK